MSSVPTIQDVAREAGVSPATVSNVLNGRWKQTSPATRERILEVAKRLNYRPNAMAAALRTRRTRTVAVVFTNILNPFYTAVLRGIQDEARRAGYTIVLANSDDSPDVERESLSTFRAQQVDGLIITTTGENDELLKTLPETGVPTVLVDRGDPELHLDTVRVDNVSAARAAVEYLIRLGHRRIAIISGLTTGAPTRAGRVEGYHQALEAAGIARAEEYEQILPSSVENGRAAAGTLLNLPDPPTALFAANTFLAIGAMECIRERGIQVPQQLSFLMFDDPEWSRIADPPITAVSQPTHRLGALAFQLLEARLRKKRPLKTEDIVLPTSLHIRRSCSTPDRNP
ncbi:MAG: LacI family DNA-binding transcriptional regulator [Bryobacterales bacterium]|nr:LacI family DNA-binding transcriptional regulator [Bryobacterales bacterium]